VGGPLFSLFLHSSSLWTWPLTIAPRITGAIGFLSAVLVVSIVIADHVNHKGNPMLRCVALMVAYGGMDALAWFFGAAAVPSSFPGGKGTYATCSLQGFWLQFVIGDPLSSLALAYYFHQVVYHEKDSQQLQRKELYLQGTIFFLCVWFRQCALVPQSLQPRG